VLGSWSTLFNNDFVRVEGLWLWINQKKSLDGFDLLMMVMMKVEFELMTTIHTHSHTYPSYSDGGELVSINK